MFAVLFRHSFRSIWWPRATSLHFVQCSYTKFHSAEALKKLAEPMFPYQSMFSQRCEKRPPETVKRTLKKGAYDLKVHDEKISDEYYCHGWQEISTSSHCKDASCQCNGSGSCVKGLFNHYMCMRSYGPPGLYGSSDFSHTDEFDFPISLHAGNSKEISVEEVRCARHVLGSAFEYFSKVVIIDRKRQTLLSVFSGTHKSVCFNSICYVVQVPTSAAVPESSLVVGSTQHSHYILYMDSTVRDGLFENLCMLGISPYVEEGDKALLLPTELLGGDAECYQPVSATPYGFVTDMVEHINYVTGPIADNTSCSLSSAESPRAVGTATVTLSVILTPISLHGGKNPDTKAVSYHVHNIVFCK